MSLSRDAYDVVLADLRAKREEIDTAIRAIEAVRPPMVMQALPQPALQDTQAPPPSVLPTKAQDGQPLAGLSIEDGSRVVLRKRGHPMRPPEIAEAFREGGLVMNSVQPGNTVSSVLHRGWRNGSDIVLVKRGTWGLAEWYPDQDTSFRENREGASEAGEVELAEEEPADLLA